MTAVVGVLAHGIGGRSDLPLPVWLFAYGAGMALVISFVALRILWPRPRLADAANSAPLPPRTQALARALAWPVRIVGLALFAVVLAAALWGTEIAAANLAPVAIYVVFWVGLQLVSALVGDVWAVLSPYETLARLGRGIGRRFRSSGADRAAARPDPGHWTAAVMVASFVWLELAYHDPSSPRAIGMWLAVYSAAALAGAAWWGRAWLRHGEGFAGYFGLLAHLAPIGRDDRGRLCLRPPLSGLARLQTRPGTAALVLVALGSTTFDGVTRTRFWADVTGDRRAWDLTVVNTLGLLWTIGLVAVAYVAATRIAAWVGRRDATEMALAFVPSLVPIALAYAVAHYFSLAVFEGQNAVALASDPLGRGWDLFGTIDRSVDYRALSTTTIAYVQAGAIVAGHVAGVVAAHDRAVELFPARRAQSTQYPMLAVMVLYTVGGLALLLGA